VLIAVSACIAGYCALTPNATALAVSTEAMARCATIPADAERLTCYDRLARGGAPTDQAPMTPPPERPSQSFGNVKPPTIKPQGPSHMEAKVVDIKTDSRGDALVQLDNDQTWTVEDSPAVLQAGDAIVIKRAALGSFLMTTPTKRVYRVRRVR